MNLPGTAHRTIAVEPPELDPGDVAIAVQEQFALAGEYSPLVSERDQNFRLLTPGGDEYVVKVVGAAEPPINADFQVAALAHLECAGMTNTPRAIRTIDGRFRGCIECNGTKHVLRVVSYVAGKPMLVSAIDAEVAREFGCCLAKLDMALRGFSHDGENPVLLWDLQRVPELRSLLHHIDDTAAAETVVRTIDDFEAFVIPGSASLRRQVIHGDANPENILMDETGRTVTGFIDFGDMVKAPVINDVAIAAAYLRPAGDDAMSLIAPFVAGYHFVAPLQREETLLLYDLVRARLATTICILYWRLAARDESDPYRQKTLDTESGARHFLKALDDIGRDAFLHRLDKAIGRS